MSRCGETLNYLWRVYVCDRPAGHKGAHEASRHGLAWPDESQHFGCGCCHDPDCWDKRNRSEPRIGGLA